MNDDVFEKTLKFVLQREGGYVNDPHDLGGETNKGVTHNTYNAYRRSKGLPVRSVKYITDNEVRDIYYNNYYRACGADKIQNPQLAAYAFDTAVNMGVSRALAFLRQSGGNPDKFEQLRRAKYDEFVKAKPDQKRYLLGWNNRVTAVKNFSKENLPASREQVTAANLGNSNNGSPNFGQEPTIPGVLSANVQYYIDEKETLPWDALAGAQGSGSDKPSGSYSGEFQDKIFTREDIGRMSQQEYADNKNAIEAQMSKIGLPKSSEVKINYSGRSSGSSGSSGRSGGSSGLSGSVSGRWVTIDKGNRRSEASLVTLSP